MFGRTLSMSEVATDSIDDFGGAVPNLLSYYDGSWGVAYVSLVDMRGTGHLVASTGNTMMEKSAFLVLPKFGGAIYVGDSVISGETLWLQLSAELPHVVTVTLNTSLSTPTSAGPITFTPTVLTFAVGETRKKFQITATSAACGPAVIYYNVKTSNVLSELPPVNAQHINIMSTSFDEHHHQHPSLPLCLPPSLPRSDRSSRFDLLIYRY